MTTHRFTARLPLALHARVLKSAEQDHRTANAQVVTLLQRGLERTAPDHTDQLMAVLSQFIADSELLRAQFEDLDTAYAAAVKIKKQVEKERGK